MVKRILLTATLLTGGAMSAGNADLDDFKMKVVAFDTPYARLTRSLFGCSQNLQEAMDISHCNIAQGSLDYKQFEKARRAAMVLFDLKEKHE